MKFIVLLFLFCVYQCVSMPHMQAVLREARRGSQIPRTRARGGCETLCGCWELNPSLLQEQQVGGAVFPAQVHYPYQDLLCMSIFTCVQVHMDV